MSKTAKTNNRKESNKYDKIIRENLMKLLPAIFSKVLGIKQYRIEHLPAVKFQTTLEREPDFLKKVYDTKFPKGRILHIEFQGGNETYMDARMLEYSSILYRKFRIPIEQHLIFMGAGKSTMNNKIEFPGLSFSFKIYNISEISYKEFINSDQPEAVILGILANRDKLMPREIVNLILQRLVKVSKDTLATRKFIRQLEIISKLRNLQEITSQIIDNMDISFDIKTDVRYKQGEEVGLEKGLAKGITIGTQIKTIIATRKMLLAKLDHALICDFLEVTTEYVKEIEIFLKKEKGITQALSIKRARVNTIAKKFGVSPIFVRALKQMLNKQKKKK